MLDERDLAGIAVQQHERALGFGDRQRQARETGTRADVEYPDAA